MSKPQPTQQPIAEDDVLRRMLTTPPKQHEVKPAKVVKPARKKARAE